MQPAHIREINASDTEVCHYEDQTLIYYTGANQGRAGDLQWATYPGTPAELFAEFFEPSSGVASETTTR